MERSNKTGNAKLTHALVESSQGGETTLSRRMILKYILDTYECEDFY
jgi:hypothetical protein